MDKTINLDKNEELLNKVELRQLGERSLLKIISDKFKNLYNDKAYLIKGIGDDCAAMAVPEGKAIVTTVDACPTPVICLIDEMDYWYYGWFTMIISLSDLASMGADPKGMLLSVEAPIDMKLKDFNRFYDGIIEASQSFDCPIIGGNVKDSTKFAATSTAIGYVDKNLMLQRNNAEAGDVVVVLGDMGTFWSGVISKLRQLNIDFSNEDMQVLFKNLKKPVPRLKEGKALLEYHISKCAMDCSDGLIACFYDLAENGRHIDLKIDLSDFKADSAVENIAEVSGIDIEKLLMTWGNWQLVCTVKREKMQHLQAIMRALECPVNVVGEVVAGSGKVWYKDLKQEGILNYITSERFTNSSYFSFGLEAYLNYLIHEPLVIPLKG